MNQTEILYVAVQSITVVLLALSESLPFNNSPYNGVLHAIVSALQKFEKKGVDPTIVVTQTSP